MTYPANQMYLMSGEDTLTRFWAASFGLAAENHQVIFAAEVVATRGIRALIDRIERGIVANNISMLLIDISSPVLDPFVIAALKQEHSLMIVLLAPDDEFKFDWISSSYATIADLVLTTDYVSVDRYRQAGVNAHFFVLPIYVPNESTDQRIDELKSAVSFVGRVDSHKPSRLEFAEFLAANGVCVRYFSSNMASEPRFLSREEMCSVFRSSAINLNFSGITTYALKYNNVLCAGIRGMKIRPLEIIAAGGFCISEFSISLAKVLDDRVDVVFFKSKHELLEKIQYFLGHQDEARTIAANGRRRVAEQFCDEAVAKTLAALISDSQGYVGKDLYGEQQRVRVSESMASSFMLLTLSSSVTLLLRGRWRSCVDDVSSVAGFVKRFSANGGTLVALRVVVVVAYRFVKVRLAVIASRIARPRTTIGVVEL